MTKRKRVFIIMIHHHQSQPHNSNPTHSLAAEPAEEISLYSKLVRKSA